MRNTHQRIRKKGTFNNFAKFSVKYLSWSLFLIKLQAWWCTIYHKETLAQSFSSKFSEIFKNIYLVGHIQTDAWIKWTNAIVFIKSVHRTTSVETSFLAQFLGLTAFPKGTPSQMLFYENCEVLQKVNFTEHCRAIISDYQHFQFITCIISNKSVQS